MARGSRLWERPPAAASRDRGGNTRQDREFGQEQRSLPLVWIARILEHSTERSCRTAEMRRREEARFAISFRRKRYHTRRPNYADALTQRCEVCLQVHSIAILLASCTATFMPMIAGPKSRCTACTRR